MFSALCEAMYQFAISHLRTHIFAAAFTDNIGSQKIMLKAGYTFVGRVETYFKLGHKGRTDCSIIFVYEWKL